MPQLKQTASVTNGSQTVTMAGNVAAQILKNFIFMVEGEFVPYFVAANAAYNAGTGLTTFNLTGNYLGITSAVAPGVIAGDQTAPDGIPILRQGDVGTAAIFAAAMNRIQQLVRAPKAIYAAGGDGVTPLAIAMAARLSADFVASAATVQASANVSVYCITATGTTAFLQLQLQDLSNGGIVTTSVEQYATSVQSGARTPVTCSLVYTGLVIGRSYRLLWNMRAEAANRMCIISPEIVGLNL